jgi:hypothetical protein
MPVDLDDPKMEGYVPLQQYRDLDTGTSSRRIREDSDEGPLTEVEVKAMLAVLQDMQIDERLATEQDALELTSATKLAVPATVRTAVEQAEFSFEDMQNPETLQAIINRTGRTPFMDGALSADASHHAVINACIDKVITGGGGIVWMPPIAGEWKIGGPINLFKTGVTGSYLKFQGIGEKVRMKRLNATGDIFVVGDGATPVYYVHLKNILLNAVVPRTSGIDIKMQRCNQMFFEDMVFDGSYAGIQADHSNTCYFNRIVINMPNQTTGYGVIIRSEPATGYRTDIVKLSEVTIQAYNAGSYGMLVSGRVHGCHTDGVYALGTRRGLAVTSSALSTAWGDIPSFGDYRKFETDRALDISVVLEKGYRNEFYRAEFSNTSGAADVPYPQGSADNCALYIGPGMTDTKFSLGRIGNCRQQAVQDYGLGTQFLGTTFNDMSKAGAGVAAAVYIGAAARAFNYQACRIEGYSRASYAFQMEAASKNGIIRDTIYKDIVNTFNAGTGTNVTMSGQKDDSV